MIVHSVTPVLNVSSVVQSLRWLELFGFQRTFTWNHAGSIAAAADGDANGPAHFAGISLGGCQMLLCQDGQGSRGKLPRHTGDEETGGVWMSWWVQTPAEVDAFHAIALKHGVAINLPPTDASWGVRECWLSHPDGHTFRVSCGIGPAKQSVP